MQNLKGKVAIITGASSGIGEATARLLVAEGVSVPEEAMRERRASVDALTAEDVAPALVYPFAQHPRVLVEEILIGPVKQVAP